MEKSPLAEALASLNENDVIRLTHERIKNGRDPLSIVKELQAGIGIFGERYKTGDYFIADLILAGEIFRQSMLILEPLLVKTEKKTDGNIKIVLGTVKGDIHNLGKDILGLLLKPSGFQVYDLGINVPPSAFVNKLQETGAPLLGLSGLITPSYEAMKETILAVTAVGLRDKVKIIVGGGVVDELVREYTGADAFSTDALEGIETCKRLAGGESK
jgi:5-methyltetrahydrofolate--homocysteine methyltransferase